MAHSDLQGGLAFVICSYQADTKELLTQYSVVLEKSGTVFQRFKKNNFECSFLEWSRGLPAGIVQTLFFQYFFIFRVLCFNGHPNSLEFDEKKRPYIYHHTYILQ